MYRVSLKEIEYTQYIRYFGIKYKIHFCQRQLYTNCVKTAVNTHLIIINLLDD